MDQDKEFEKYWAGREKGFRLAHNCDGDPETLKAVAREVWYGALNAAGAWLKEYRTLRHWKEKMDEQVPTESLLHDLKKRGGHVAVLAEAGMIALKKGEDYNTGFPRDHYFPMGLQSYAQMIWVKALRLVSFAKHPRKELNEGVRDTLLDLINYSSFAADWLGRKP